MRSGRNGEQFCGIEKKVSVDHGGSIVTDKPLDLGNSGFILFDKNNAMNFMGEDITFKQFMEGDFETKEGFKLE